MPGLAASMVATVAAHVARGGALGAACGAGSLERLMACRNVARGTVGSAAVRSVPAVYRVAACMGWRVALGA